MSDQDLKGGQSLVPWALAERLRAVLAKRRISQRQLAEATGIPQATIATYLAGRVAMPITALAAISRATQSDPGWLLNGEDHHLDGRALIIAALKAEAKTKAFDLSTPAAEKAFSEALGWISIEYGAACNFLHYGQTGHEPGVVTFSTDPSKADTGRR